ncbi:hypothetical protein [Streptomyces sp. IMTB 1903]|uniref:hypothetical protein n=1 Tax=Streptomyces sp. IMTB 1903 TaxID=1776680 RepID=UPI000A3E84FA|nr:hypothetical protein [Streptomyces sp. IMTB 1903]
MLVDVGVVGVRVRCPDPFQFPLPAGRERDDLPRDLDTYTTLAYKYAGLPEQTTSALPRTARAWTLRLPPLYGNGHRP